MSAPTSDDPYSGIDAAEIYMGAKKPPESTPLRERCPACSGSGGADIETLYSLGEILEFLNDEADVTDGAYGEPHPNTAMQLAERLRRILISGNAGNRP